MNLGSGTLGVLGVMIAPEPTGGVCSNRASGLPAVLLAAGESVVVVAEWLGHHNATLVLTTYGPLMPQLTVLEELPTRWAAR
ncbi:MAG: hypothetical protein ACRDTA_24090 [Pseudonocardiaceae bacterium]